MEVRGSAEAVLDQYQALAGRERDETSSLSKTSEVVPGHIVKTLHKRRNQQDGQKSHMWTDLIMWL